MAFTGNTAEPVLETKQQQLSPVQCALTVGAPDDPLEHEADAMADTVMRMPNVSDTSAVSDTFSPNAFLQRKCAHCEEEEKAQRKPLSASITPFIQTKSNGEGTTSASLSNKINNSHGGGSSMDNGTKTFMESRFGSDFSSVKIHTGSESVMMNRELSAKAFTVGNDIYFNDGQYNPQSDSGKHLLAHELTHTIQQGKGIQPKKIQRAPIRFRGRLYMDGNVTVNAAARADILRHNNLLTSADQAHIIVTGANKLAYETSYLNPQDPFRWNMLKHFIDHEAVEIRAVGSTQRFNSRVIRNVNGARTVTTEPVTLSLLRAGGLTLSTEARQIAINPAAPLFIASTSSTAHQVYYETGAQGRGMMGSNSLAHELFGHLWLAVNNVPHGHGQSLTGTTGITDPLGRTFTGSVDDFISNFAGATRTTFQSPTQHVSIQSLTDTLQWIEQNGAGHIITTGNGGFDSDLSTKWEILSTNYDVLRTSSTPVNIPATGGGTGVSLNAADLRTRITTWANALPLPQRTAFRNVLRMVLTSFSSNHRMGLARDISGSINIPAGP